MLNITPSIDSGVARRRRQRLDFCIPRLCFPVTLFLLILLGGKHNSAEATDWSRIGPDSVTVLNYLASATSGCLDVLATDNGLLTYDGETWEFASYGQLPVQEVIDYTPGHLLLVQGNGSYSDGVYDFACSSREFTVRFWYFNPRFLLRDPLTGTYWAGAEFGVARSPDGIDWEEIPDMLGHDCQSMVISGDDLLVAAGDLRFRSTDGGDTWETLPETSPYIGDMALHTDGRVYGVFPGQSWSSGLWSTADWGATWEVEFWSPDVRTVESAGPYLLVGWESPWIEWTGVALWYPEQGCHQFMNDGLPCLSINRLTQNHLIDCMNVVACTAAGAFITCDFPEPVDIHLEIRFADGQVTLQWNPYPGAVDYRVYSASSLTDPMQPDNGGTFNGCEWISQPTTDIRFYQVRAVLEQD